VDHTSWSNDLQRLRTPTIEVTTCVLAKILNRFEDLNEHSCKMGDGLGTGIE